MAEDGTGLGELGFAGDDHVVPFQVEGLDVRGRAVQLGPLLDAILERHDYPAAGGAAPGRGDRADRRCSARR